MDFLKELRKTVHNIEKNIQEIQSSISKTRRRPKDESAGDKAVLLLRDKQEQIVKLKKETCRMLRSVRGDPVPFEHILKLCEQLHQINLDNLEKTEMHLKEYGFEPPLPKTATLPDSICPEEPSSSEPPVTATSPQPVSNSIVTASPATPETNVKTEIDLSRTPNLADFGVSEYTMQLFSGTAQKGSRSDQLGLGKFKVPAVSFEGSSQTSNRLETTPKPTHQHWYSSVQVPKELDNDGLLVTPGVMPGIDRPCTPLTAGLAEFGSSPVGYQVPETPDISSGHFPIMRLKSDSSEDGQGTSGDQSPLPPVLCTPGIKQLSHTSLSAKHDTSTVSALVDADSATPEAPILMTPGIRQIRDMKNKDPPVSPDNKHLTLAQATGSEDTPEAPVMMTPGIRQLNQLSTKLHTDQHPSTTALLATPPSPELILSYPVKKNVTHEPVKSSSEAISNTGSMDLDVSIAVDRGNCGVGTSSPDSNFLSSKRMLKTFEEVCDTPEAPELTFSYKGVLTAQPPLTTSLKAPFATTLPDQPAVVALAKSAPVSPALSCPPSDMGTPPTPELTFSYRPQEVAMATRSKSSDKENQRPRPSVNKSQSHSKSHMFERGPPAMSFPEEMATSMSVPTLTTQEYEDQPDYLKTVLDLGTLNQTIKHFNIMLHKKIKGHEKPLVSGLDLHDDLTTTQKRVFFICLMRLGYVKIKHSAQGQSYYGLAQ